MSKPVYFTGFDKTDEVFRRQAFTVCSALGARAGAVFHTIWNQERIKNGIDSPDTEVHDTDKAIRIAVEAIKLLIERDKNR